MDKLTSAHISNNAAGWIIGMIIIVQALIVVGIGFGAMLLFT